MATTWKEKTWGSKGMWLRSNGTKMKETGNKWNTKG